MKHLCAAALLFLGLASCPCAEQAVVAERGNRLDDPGFDLGGSAWRWFPWYQATDAAPSFDERIRHDGRRSIHFPGQGESIESRLYALPAGRTWTLSAWVRGNPAGPREGTGFVMFLMLAGVAVMLGALHESFHASLVFVPGIALAISVGAFMVARKRLPEKAFTELKAQLDADAKALRAVSARG